MERKGSPSPLGATKTEKGVNFAIFSQHAEKVVLCLFIPGRDQPFLEKELSKTGYIWHGFIPNPPHELEYAFRVFGPYHPDKGELFNSSVLLSDPYAHSLNTSHHWGESEMKNLPFSPLGRVISSPPFSWEGDAPLNIPLQDLIIYEMHIRGFSRDPSSQVKHSGTFLGVIEKIPYLKELGVNAVELMPIYEFNECEYRVKNPLNQSTLYNYWGYSTVNFFSPTNRYAFSSAWGAAITEFKLMVRELHRHGIEVILDVVYNHTAEGGENGPYLSFRGLDNRVYYMVDEQGGYRDYTGCGNTFNANHNVSAKLILDSLRYWVTEMHVDGFRFDLASILTRDCNGHPLREPPVIKAISEDPILAHTKLIAEAWDAGGLYQVGGFPSWHRWYEWNGKYRDAVRSFLKGTDQHANLFAEALSGSQSLYGHDRRPYHSVNFVTAHDGFTLRDLVTYQMKHNEANGEENRDGTNQNDNWNCGIEGPTQDPIILALRQRQMRNVIVALMVSLGTPMILMGDEYGHTREGNNNAWNQDNALNWMLWKEIEKNSPFFRFYRLMLAFRKAHSLVRRTDFLTEQDITWHGLKPQSPDWGAESRFVSYTLCDSVQHHNLYIAFNAHYLPTTVELPDPPPNRSWRRIVDTSLSSPEDFCETPQDALPPPTQYPMPDHTAIILKAF